MDQMRCEGGPTAVLLVNLWMTPCACGHVMLEHDIIDVGKKKGQRSGCMTTERSGKCPCKVYSPVLATSDTIAGS